MKNKPITYRPWASNGLGEKNLTSKITLVHDKIVDFIFHTCCFFGDAA